MKRHPKLLLCAFTVLLLSSALISVWHRPSSVKKSNLDDRPFDTLSKSEQITYLIDRLTDTENEGNRKKEELLLGLEMFPAAGRSTTPPSRLVDMGLVVVVPQVIEALNDKRITHFSYLLSAGRAGESSLSLTF